MPVRSRRAAREACLCALYEWEIGGEKIETAVDNTVESSDLSADLENWFRTVTFGVIEGRESLDRMLQGKLQDWDLPRMATVDRNILRIAAFELFHMPPIPPAVTINEAVELAKKYSTAESGKFVNGVLGQVLQASPKAGWDPSQAPEEEPYVPDEPESEADVEMVEEGSPEAAELQKVGLWRVREDRGA